MIKTVTFCLLALSTSPAFAQSDGPPALVDKFMQAWSASDAKALSELFTADADFISPFGIAARGRAAIESFYAGAFARGYKGSAGTGEIVSARALGPDITIVDAHFTITGARNPDGTPRPQENGIMVAVLHKGDAGWQIAALRENEGASNVNWLR